MRSLLDINLLIALLDPDHIFHDSAHCWWRDNRDLGWASCPLTQNGVLRIMSSPSYGANSSLGLDEIIDALGGFIASSDHVFWADDMSLLDPHFFDHDKFIGSKQLTDVYLLGLSTKNGGRLATFDQRIALKAVKRAGPEDLIIVDVNDPWPPNRR